ncbi:hypothetical protein [Mesohalobacter halotolerans]|uniref:Magnesium citrate secondary transporter n=1 Tax=Mesohalobacter halotolerans TaxID=1883405 RepID=A0A4V6ALG4_9FLAO|nr:hypothetical protein [Mesohalobacter halotolerans]MBS3739264.1 hypothetical protein [Psychroflexus sp.]TKS56685.1 hypothetical protein FCN74_06550 [Mesohalobacter halotolerans]
MKKETPVIILVSFSGILFLIHQYIQMQTQFNIAILDNYLDPLVLMPLILYALVWERRILLQNKNIDLPHSHILGYFILIVLIGEFIFPLISENFTTDFWDILAYACGTLTYVLMRKFPISSNSKN